MDERGWGWANSQIRLTRLVGWLAQADDEIHVEPFYLALPDWLANSDWVADAKLLAERSLIQYSYPLSGLKAWVTPAGKDQADSLKAVRADRRKRRAACRDAMVAWLCSCDATSPHPTSRKPRELMLAEPRYGVWFAESFTDQDLDEAAEWLHQHGLIDGFIPDQYRGPALPYLTDDGIECAEDLDADTRRYLAAKRAPVRSGRTLNIAMNNAPIQIAGDNAHQVQNLGAERG